MRTDAPGLTWERPMPEVESRPKGFEVEGKKVVEGEVVL